MDAEDLNDGSDEEDDRKPAAKNAGTGSTGTDSTCTDSTGAGSTGAGSTGTGSTGADSTSTDSTSTGTDSSPESPPAIAKKQPEKQQVYDLEIVGFKM